MENSQHKKKNDRGAIKPIEKPMLYAERAFAKPARRYALTVFGYQLLAIVLYFLLGSALSFGSVAVRVITNLLLYGAVAALLFISGSSWGVQDAQFSEIMFRRNESGKPIPQTERDRCFGAKKAWVAMALGVLPFFIAACVLAIFTQRMGYQLQSLPRWMTTSARREEFSYALSYYQSVNQVQWLTIFRTVVRLDLFPLVQMVGAENYDALLVLERLSPLLCLVAPLAFPIGYKLGKRDRALTHGSIARAERRKKIKEKKERRARQQKGPEQLI